MSSEWLDTTIGSQLSLQRGFDITKATQQPGNVPVISSGGTNSYHSTAMVKGPGVVLGRKGVVGSMYFVKEDYWPHDTTLWVKDFHGNDELFAYYFFLSKAKELAQLDVGSANPTLNRNHVHPIKVCWPPLHEQKQIAQMLGAFDDRIALLRETNATLEAIAQALFKSWFVDFDPVHARVRGEQADGISENLAALFPDSFEESPLGLVPRGWKVELIGPWLEVLETGRRPKGGVSGISEGVPSIGAESIVSIGQFDYSKTKFVSEEFFTKMRSGELQSHDVLLYKDGGKPGVFLPRVSMFGDGFPFERCGINEHVFRMRVKPPLNQAFLYFWVWSDAAMHELKHRGGKAAIPGINQADVRELKLAVPNKGVLNAFDDLTAPLISKIFSNAKQAQTLATLRDSLLPRLISGQLRLPEAETLIVGAVQ
jgi:type I restriction enzyme, S subunit